MTVPRTAAEPRGLWSRLERQFALVSLRPRLAPSVRVRQIGDEFELFDIESRRVLPIDAAEAAIARRLDGEHTIAEIIVADIGAGELSVDPVLSLVDRLVRAELLDRYPAHIYRVLDRHFNRITARCAAAQTAADQAAALAAATADDPADPASATAGATPRRTTPLAPWRARSPRIAERARFLRTVSLLAGLDLHSIGALADGAHEEAWPAASTIVSEGGRADRFFIITSGEVHVRRRNPATCEPDSVARLGPGEWFGEAGLLDKLPRNASVCAGDMRDVQVLSFDAEQFDSFIRPHVTSSSRDGLVSRRRRQLERVPLFRALAPEDLDRLARVLREQVAERGNVLFRQGEPADCFYVIEHGSVGVVKDGAPIAKLVAGEFFGETALLFTEDRTATIAATEHTRFWVLDRDSFDTFLRDAMLHRRDLMPTVLNRLGSTQPV